MTHLPAFSDSFEKFKVCLSAIYQSYAPIMNILSAIYPFYAHPRMAYCLNNSTETLCKCQWPHLLLATKMKINPV